jgi:hypothetical protein
MKILSVNREKSTITVLFSWHELYMLVMATGGSVFGGTMNRDIPVLADWTRDEALAFEGGIIKIRQALENSPIEEAEMTLSYKELVYLAKIHDDNMQELDPIEYPMLVGLDWEEAEQLLEDLQKAAALISPNP